MLPNFKRDLFLQVILYKKSIVRNSVSKKLNNSSSWIPDFIDFLYKLTEWRTIKGNQNYFAGKVPYQKLYLIFHYFLKIVAEFAIATRS